MKTHLPVRRNNLVMVLIKRKIRGRKNKDKERSKLKEEGKK